MKIDDDVMAMETTELRREVMRLRIAFKKEASHTGNHRCWITLLEATTGHKINPIDIPKDVFIKNCNRYYDRNSRRT